MTHAEFIAEAKHAFRAENIDPEGPTATAIINNLAMVVASEEHAQADGSRVVQLGSACMTCEAGCDCDETTKENNQ